MGHMKSIQDLISSDWFTLHSRIFTYYNSHLHCLFLCAGVRSLQLRLILEADLQDVASPLQTWTLHVCLLAGELLCMSFRSQVQGHVLKCLLEGQSSFIFLRLGKEFVGVIIKAGCLWVYYVAKEIENAPAIKVNFIFSGQSLVLRLHLFYSYCKGWGRARCSYGKG